MINLKICKIIVVISICSVFLMACGNGAVKDDIRMTGLTENEESIKTEDNTTKETEKNTMEYEWDSYFKFDTLDTYFEIHVAGMYGECFEYNIYFDDGANADRVAEVDKAIYEWSSQYDDEDDYVGYIDVSLAENSVFVYLDLGSMEEEEGDRSLYGIINAIKDIKGIKCVIVNEGAADMDDFGM